MTGRIVMPSWVLRRVRAGAAVVVEFCHEVWGGTSSDSAIADGTLALCSADRLLQPSSPRIK